MQKTLTLKIGLMLLIMVGFLVLFAMLRGIVHERQGRYQQVMSEISRDNVRSQSVLGPFIVVPVETVEQCVNDNKKTVPCTTTTQRVIVPKSSQWTNTLTVDPHSYQRGIYHALTYQNRLSLTGQFVPDASLLKPAANQTVQWAEAKLYLSLSDLRGLNSQPVLTVNQQKYVFELPSDGETAPFNLPYTRLNLGVIAQQPSLQFQLDVAFAGMDSLAVQPLGKDMHMTVHANWPHPSFFGGQLPSKQLRAKDFSATWQSSYLSNQNSQTLVACITQQKNASCEQLQPRYSAVSEYDLREQGDAVTQMFGVRFVDPVNVYLLTDRTLKYALLFVVLTFAAFFLFEVLKDLRIHPIQYTLVGMALATFYLLLLSFSEHIAFGLAYLGSSVACVLLICCYVSFVLHGIRRALGLGVILSAMYGTLYVILQSEDHALVLGSVLVFVVIASIMLITRHVDWYQIGQRDRPLPSQTPAHRPLAPLSE
jgi:inner membrane protein